MKAIREALESAQAGVWRGFYAGALSAPYAHAADEKIRAALAELDEVEARVRREERERIAAMVSRIAEERRSQIASCRAAGGALDALEAKLSEAERILAALRAPASAQAPAPDTAWRPRAPTPAEVEAHARAHPFPLLPPGEGYGGLWQIERSGIVSPHPVHAIVTVNAGQIICTKSRPLDAAGNVVPWPTPGGGGEVK